ncbi:MAG: anti-sigma factor family protein [Planctomycetota bacterium]|jgi:hypothetical protein
MNDKCEFTGEELSAFVDGELDAVRADALASHLETCNACASEVSHYRRIDTVAESSYGPSKDTPAVPEKRWDDMWRSISDGLEISEGNKSGRPPVRMTWLRSIAAAAMILVAIVLLFALPWGEKPNGEKTVLEEPVVDIVDIDDYHEDYQISIVPMEDADMINMTYVEPDTVEIEDYNEEYEVIINTSKDAVEIRIIKENDG